jgi:hypothetical protein
MRRPSGESVWAARELAAARKREKRKVFLGARTPPSAVRRMRTRASALPGSERERLAVQLHKDDLGDGVLQLLLLRRRRGAPGFDLLRGRVNFFHQHVGLLRTHALRGHELERLFLDRSSGGERHVDELVFRAGLHLEKVEDQLPERVGFRRAGALDVDLELVARLGAEDHDLEEKRTADFAADGNDAEA